MISERIDMTIAGVLLTYINLSIANAENNLVMLGEAKNVIQQAIRRCVNCGKPLPENTTLCEWCGWENNSLLK